MIGQKLSNLSCDKAAIKKAAPEYNKALQKIDFKRTIEYKFSQSSPHRNNNNNNMKNRKQNII